MTLTANHSHASYHTGLIQTTRKRIDVFPTTPPSESPATGETWGLQMLGEENRAARFRNALKPEAMIATKYEVEFPYLLNRHFKGPSDYVQFSTWFPLFDRNPQVCRYKQTTESDFQKALNALSRRAVQLATYCDCLIEG